MATTISALKLPTVPPRARSKLYNLPTQIQTKLNHNSQITHQKIKDEQQLVQTLNSYTLPLSTVALPFILDTQVIFCVKILIFIEFLGFAIYVLIISFLFCFWVLTFDFCVLKISSLINFWVLQYAC